jgi:nicotinamidase-related amidase
MSLLDRVKPGISRRADFALRRNKCALLIIDVQKYLSYPEHEYFQKFALPRAMKNIETMAHQFRAARDSPNATGCEVIFTYVQSSTKDGRDMSLDYKLSGPMLANIPRIGDTDIFTPECTPDPHTGKGDILLPKTSCSVFQSTNIDYLLRNLGIEQIVVCGQLTDECVESAVRDGADLGYLMTVPEDACAAISPERHKIGLQGMHGFCRILKTTHITWEIAESVEAFRSDNISLEVLTTFLKGRGFADAAIEVASAFAKNGNRSPSSSRRALVPVSLHPDDGGTNDIASNEDVVTVSSAVMDNILQQQNVISNVKVKNPGFHTRGSPKATSSRARNLKMEQEAATPPTRNGSLVLPRYTTNNIYDKDDPDRGRDPTELLATPDLNRASGPSNVSTNLTSSQYHTQMNSQRTKTTTTSHNRANSSTKSLHTRHRNSIPVDLDDSPEQPKNQRDPPEVTNELLEL